MPPDQIDYKGVLADLKARRGALDQAISAIEAILGESGTVIGAPINGAGAGGTVLKEVKAGTFFNLNTVDASKKYLNIAGDVQTTEQIADALRRGSLEVKPASIAVLLKRAIDKGDTEVVRVSRGVWGLSKWFSK